MNVGDITDRLRGLAIGYDHHVEVDGVLIGRCYTTSVRWRGQWYACHGGRHLWRDGRWHREGTGANWETGDAPGYFPDPGSLVDALYLGMIELGLA